MSLHVTSGFFLPKAPFDFAHTLSFLGHFPPTHGEQSLSSQCLEKVMLLNGSAVAFTLRSTGTVESPRMEWTITSHRPLSNDEQLIAEDRFRFFISADDDLQPFYKTARSDVAFWPIVETCYGFHQPKFFTPFENAAWAVMTQRLPIPMARRLKDAFVSQLGFPFDDGERIQHAFPDAATVARASLSQLQSLLPGRKADFVHAVALAFSQVDESFLRHGPLPDVLSWLRAIPGMGPWSSAFVAIRGLGRVERVDLEESRVSSAAAQVYNAGRPLSPSQLQSIADRYDRFQGYWAIYLRATERTRAHTPVSRRNPARRPGVFQSSMTG